MYDKSTTAPIVFQQIFLSHRHQYNTYIPIFTDGSKTTTRVGCGVVIADVPSSFQLNALCSVLTAELTAIFLALERISDLLEHKFCISSDSKSALEALSHPQNGTHPLALDILCLLQSLQARDFQILFCWLPGHVGIQGNELADAAAKTATTSWQQPLPYADIKKFISNHVHNLWQISWDRQVSNKLHSIKPRITLWPALPIRFLPPHSFTLTYFNFKNLLYITTSLYVSPYVWRSMAKSGPCAIKPKITHSLTHSLRRLYASRPSHILPLCERTKMLLHDSDLNNVFFQLSDFFTFSPWDSPQFSFLNPFSGFDKSSTAPITFQQLFHHHRCQYSSFVPIFTDGLKSDGHVGCGVVFPSDTLSYRLHNCCSVFTAELVAIFCALQEILPSHQRNFILYTDSMSALETLSHYDNRIHPVALEILSVLQFLRKKGFNIIFCWVPSHVGISGNETADVIARFASDFLPRALPYCDIKKFLVSHLLSVWQQKWNLLTRNKLYPVKPSVGLWPAFLRRELDVKLTRLRIGHTRFTHRHLFLGQRAPRCPTCHTDFTVNHILVECPSFKCHREYHFNSSSVTLQDLVDLIPRYIKERQLQNAVNRLVAWCDENGHTISAEKSRCVHFCRKRNIHQDPNIRIRNVPIPVVNEIRFLGVIFDRKFTFLPHTLHLRKKCERSLNILKVLSRTSWGADRTSLFRIYQAVILSSIDYGSMVYGSARPTVFRRLDTIHHSALRICSGAFRTSPVESLYVICHQLQLHLRRQISTVYFFRARSLANLGPCAIKNQSINQSLEHNQCQSTQ
ncbi:hypothetical protein AVEN_199467-1 [Araneus ventricosus]|uniref:ribonuclease H n=1 Tax=Araneus ventricosus TaxID=182803 RepID=A0A4Y2LC53_ARAVE|nr:hypothetical protein AVEN_199467-1 [Araneus ventricosus]